MESILKTASLFSISALIAITLFPDITLADEYLAETDFFGESPVVLTVSRLHKPLQDSPASVSVIDRQMIRNSGAREIADIFRMVPGFIVGYREGSTPAVTYHGLGGKWQRELQVLIDGRSVFIPSFGGVPWSNLPLLLEDIERIEVTRGPNAVTYGANAFLATINIITRHAAEDIGSQISVTHDLDGDSEAKDVYFRVGNQIGDLDWRITAGLEEDDGFVNENDSKLLRKLNLRTDFLTAYNQFWTIQAGINKSTFGRGGEAGVSDIARDEEASNSYQNIKWELVQDRVNTTVQLSHTRQNIDDLFKTGRLNEDLDIQLGIPPGFGFAELSEDITFAIDYGRKSDRTDLEIYQNRQITDNTSLVYGGSLRQDEVRSVFFFNNDEIHTVRASRLFSSVEWKYRPDLIIDVGAMLEKTSYTDTDLSSRFSIIKSLNRHHLRLVTSSAKRNPFLYEINGDSRYNISIPSLAAFPALPNSITLVGWSTDGALRPESIQSTEIGLFSEFPERQITTDIKIYHYDIKDQIIESSGSAALPGLTPPEFYLDNVKKPQNQAETSVNGIEGSLNFSPRHKNYRLYAGLNTLRANSNDQDIEKSFPEITAFSGGHMNIDSRQQLSFALYYLDAMSWMDNSSELNGYTRLDLRYQFTLDKKQNTRLELIGYNVADQNPEYRYSQIQEKSFLARISSRF